MGCMGAKILSDKMIKIEPQQNKSQEQINFVVVPPSEAASEISNLSNVLKVNPQKLFRKTDVENCFAYAANNFMPHNWTYTQQGFQILNVINENFSTKGRDIQDLRKTTARPGSNIYEQAKA